MDIVIDERPGATVVALKGRLDFEAAAAAQAQLTALLSRPEGIHAIVIDASELIYMSSAGLRVFLTFAKEAKAASTPLAGSRHRMLASGCSPPTTTRRRPNAQSTSMASIASAAT